MKVSDSRGQHFTTTAMRASFTSVMSHRWVLGLGTRRCGVLRRGGKVTRLLDRIDRQRPAMWPGKLLGNQAPDIAEPIEQAGHDYVARQALLRQLPQRGRHA